MYSILIAIVIKGYKMQFSSVIVDLRNKTRVFVVVALQR